MDVSPYFRMPQHKVAKLIGVPVSTFSKKWCDAVGQRKWPYRKLRKIDKEIAELQSKLKIMQKDDLRRSQGEKELQLLHASVQIHVEPVVVNIGPTKQEGKEKKMSYR